MSTAQKSKDQIDSMESLQLKVETEQKPLNSDISKDQLSDQTISNKDEKVVTASVNPTGPTIPVQIQVSTPVGSGTDRNFAFTPGLYSPQAHTFFYGGYENASGEWEEYSHYVNFDGLDVSPAMVYNEDPSMMYHHHHTGYPYSPQMAPYGPYSPVATPLPNGSGDVQYYQHFPFSGPGSYFPQIPSPGPEAGHNPAAQMDGSRQYMSSDALFGRDWAKENSIGMLPSPVASPQPMHNPFGQSSVNQGQQKPYYGFGYSNNSYTPQQGYYNNYANYGGQIANSTNINSSNNRGNITPFSNDKNRRRTLPISKGNSVICSCNGSSTLDFLTEQNRGPRATRPKKEPDSDSTPEEKENNDGNKENKLGVLKGPDGEVYNSPDFETEYKDARFFIIKSYSEDNVHKSIKYRVWASTVNGNKKLDAAYREAKEKTEPCPVFLFFSVNASAQFCGVAEMAGRVDFEKSVSYWQQDKWTGQFPVKWHLLKDVPNNLFRHIILLNNDNKPVTNSRDTQEVKLEQGLEMLSIFKNHETDLSILEDFEFYEKREKLMQENRQHQQLHQLPPHQIPQLSSVAIVPDPMANNNVKGDLVIGQISKSFAHVVRVGENNNNNNNNKGAETDAIKDVEVSKVEDLKENKN
ncbi:hypothetical protein LUZ60_002192 [Juncus effusus]|nr:hypothetical protein LUZ60_002192 [Juncus effusus]